jgi:integrase
VPSAWVARLERSTGTRYRVLFRVGGRESVPQHGGIFKTAREAKNRRDWIAGELSSMRIPDLALIAPAPAETFGDVAERWRKSRVDVADGTAATHRVNLGRIVPRLGSKPINKIAAADVAGLVAELHAEKLARESIRKTRATLAMVLDFAGIQPNPARDKAVKLPREDRVEVNPPTAAHVEAVLGLLPPRYRLPAIVLDATGMRVGELEALRWADLDGPERRWRVSQAVAKTRQARWVPVPPDVFRAVTALVPREDRLVEGQVFADFGADRFRTALTCACKAAAVPLFSPHDFRHRRATLWHLAGMPAVQAAAWLGHSPTEHLKTYAHATLVDRREVTVDARTVHTRVIHGGSKTLV